MKNYWYIACQSHELSATRPLARTICGEHLALFRGPDGRAAALADRCAHRNMALSRGACTRLGLQCSYHGWTYDGQGACAFVPAEPNGKRPRVRVRSYPTVERQGFVWVYIAARAGALPAAGPIDFPMFDAPRWRHWVMQREFEGDAFHCAENFLDVPHTAFVHRGLFRKAIENVVDVEVTAGADWVQAEFLNEPAFESWIGRLLIPRRARMAHTDKFILPYTTRVDYRFSDRRHFIVMSQCTPVVPEKRTRVFTYMAFRFDPIAPLVQLFYEPLSNRILDQDVDLIREQTRDIEKFGPKSFHFHSTDAIALEIDKLLAGKKIAPGPIRKRLKV